VQSDHVDRFATFARRLGVVVAVGLETLQVVRRDVACDILAIEDRGIETLDGGLALLADGVDQVLQVLVDETVGASSVAVGISMP
jgi:hypothetical protein